jgi:hypothetical protein
LDEGKRGKESILTYKAIPNTPNLLEPLLLQPSNALLDNQIHILVRMWIIPACSLGQPLHQIEISWSIDLQRIAVKQIWDDCVVSVASELVGHQLRVLPDADYVGEIEDRGAFVDVLTGGLRDVSFDAPDFNGFAGWFTSVFLVKQSHF